ncbi:MAG: M48 family metallopeptidase [Burkholderiaceae bacterium]
MHPDTWRLIVLAALALSLAVRFWLAWRQYRHVAAHRNRVPEAFRDRIALAAHERAADYTAAKLRLGLVEAALSATLFVALTIGGGIEAVSNAWKPLSIDHPLFGQVAIVVSVVLIGSLFELPIDAWRQFVLERRFGFNRMTIATFVADLGRTALVAAVLGLPLLLAVIALMRRHGPWWFEVWLVWVAFNLVVLWIFPTWIAPLFNRFSPLAAGDVRERVEALVERNGFRADGLFVMDGSRRSAHGNAYFTGFGRGKRIVFFDTLLDRLAPAEIEAVLAHELGHFRKGHIRRRIVVSLLSSLAGLALLGWLAGQPWFYVGLGVTAPSNMAEAPALALLLFMFVLPLFAFVVRPIASWLSRRDEFEADDFAAAQSGGADLASALIKLYQDNAATLTPDPVHSAFYDSHPPAAIRVARLQRAARASPTTLQPTR